MHSLRFVDLFAGMGGFHRALSALGHECVFASELDDELRRLYLLNFPSMKDRVFGDIRESKGYVPPHDVLCAGFPCQPFSKSGAQRGRKDETRGTLFHEILDILERWKPRYVLLENVGNFSRHDGGRTWKIVRQQLESLGYAVAGSEHVTPMSDRDWRDAGLPIERPTGKGQRKQQVTRGSGLLSPHHFGHPHHRERFFIVAALDGLAFPPFPERRERNTTSLKSIVQQKAELSVLDKQEANLTAQQIACINIWNELLANIPQDLEFPAAPIWGDEFRLDYPFTPLAPYSVPLSELRKSLGRARTRDSREELLELLPRYAREEVVAFRQWKVNYISRNREWWNSVRKHVPRRWVKELADLPPSLRKLEWNVKGGSRDLWQHVLQFRPSGLRAKRYTSSPALVAMTLTQVPILGPERRFLTRTEGLRLQGFPDNHLLPDSRSAAFKALGNGVHVDVVKAIATHLFQGRSSDAETSSISESSNKACIQNLLGASYVC